MLILAMGEMMPTVTAERPRMGSRFVSVSAVVLALMVSVLLFLSDSGVVHACSCVVPGPPAEELVKFDAVFSGSVISIEHSFDPDAAQLGPGDHTTVSFDVSSVWKGNVAPRIEVTTPPTGGSCGFAFTEGEEYVVYAYDSVDASEGYSVNICSRTALLAEAQVDLDALGAGQAPQDETNVPSAEQPEDTDASGQRWIITLVAAAVVVALVGIVVYARMRRR